MGAFFSDLLTQMKAIWARLDSGQRLTVGAVLTAACVGLIAIVWVANRPSYVTIYTANSATELTDAQLALSQAGIAFQPNGGMGLSVENGQAQLANSALNTAGLRNGGSTMDLGSEMGDMTAGSKTREFLLDRKRHQTALQLIESMDGVRSASIAAHTPKRRVFAGDEPARPKGAVTLKLRPGTSFSRVAASAADILSSAVEVPVEFVVVINAATGDRWSASPERGFEQTIGDFEQLQREVARNKAEKALTQLDIYGGKVRVSVNVELDPEWETRREDIMPPEAVLVEEETTTDKTENTPPAGEGDPSLATGGNTSSSSRASGSTSTNETSKRKYYGKIGDLRRGRLAPDIKRVTCSVVIHKDLEDKQAEIEGIIKAAIGWDSERDPDTGFQVLKDEFETDLGFDAPTGPGMVELAEKWAPTVVQLIGVLLVLFFLRGMFKKPKAKASKSSDADLMALPASDEEVEEDLSSDDVARRMRKEIERVIGEDPGAVSKMVEAWLAEART